MVTRLQVQVLLKNGWSQDTMGGVECLLWRPQGGYQHVMGSPVACRALRRRSLLGVSLAWMRPHPISCQAETGHVTFSKINFFIYRVGC